ncbi:MAG TPA: pantoate--beta-alanine ligase [Fluviicola sp.]|nr:pantoate--beta-alanine ligase [Fluviicola sp.]
MKIVESIISLNEALATARETGKTIGLVPTMGALHEGHMALVERAKTMADVVVVTVFVNPTQFTNASDLTLYPRTPEKDAALLADHGCDIAFFPSVGEVYPKGYRAPDVPLGNLDKVMEGEFRPGHFKGVVQVVSRFFDIIQPTFAFFGLKDFQQVAVIRYMTDYLQLPVTIVPCPTLREPSGLAMSSRNMRLTAQQLDEAVIIYETLSLAKSLATSHSPSDTKKLALEHFAHSPLKMEYFSIVNPQTLEELTDTWVPGATACLAAFCGEVRLIDNMILN